MSKKLMQIGLIIISITFLLCICFTAFNRLKEPVFYRYCIELELPDETTSSTVPILQLRYITNIDDTRRVTGIDFSEAPEYQFYVSEHSSRQSSRMLHKTQLIGEIIGAYSVRSVGIYLAGYSGEELKEGLILHKADIMMDDGSTLTADLGVIVLSMYQQQEDAISQLSATASSANLSSSQYTVKDNITLNELQSPLLNEMNDSLKLLINGENYRSFLPKELKAGKTLNIASTFSSVPASEEAYDVYDFRPKLRYSKENGTPGYLRIYNITKYRYFDGFWDLLHYLRVTREVL